MSPLNCPEVEAQLDLYAARECDAPTGAAIARHLAGCPGCSRAFEEARQLSGLLDLHLRAPEGLRRLRAQVEAESRRPRPARRRVLPFLPRLASVAAMLLLTVGAWRWVGSGLAPGPLLPQGLAVAVLPAPSRGGLEHVAAVKAPGPDRPLVYPLASAPQRKGPLPPPPAVNLAVQLRNDGPRPVEVWLGGPRFELRLDLRGPGVVSVVAPDQTHLPFPTARKVTLAPGQAQTVSVSQLVSVQSGEVRYLYWTEPGLYTLTVRVRAPVAGAGGEPAFLTLTSAPLKIEVRGEP
jgi:hypothetical protein